MKKRLTSILTLMFFLSAQMSWAAPMAGLSLPVNIETPAFLNIEIPSHLSSLEEVYEAPSSVDPKLILHIQDLHGSYEAQTKIKEILEYLYNQYGFNLLFLEGAVNQLKPEQLHLFPDAERNKRLAEDLAKKGEVTGAELFMLTGPENVHAVGVEQPELYRKNYEAFKKVHANRGILDRFEDQISQRLETLSSLYFSRDMRRVLRDWKKFENGHRDFLPYVKRLAEDSKKFIGLDLKSLFAQVEWPQITRLLVLQTMEAELNKPQYEKEKTLLVNFLEKNKARNVLIEAIKKLGTQQVTLTRLDSEQAKLEHLPRYLLERLMEEAGPKGFFFHDYPAFSLYAGYLILKTELDSKNLFEEIERVFKKILEELAVTEGEQNILELNRDVELMRKLLHLELSRREWTQASYRKDWITPEALVKRLVKIDEENGLAGRTAQAQIGIENKNILLDLFETAFLFYDFARQRDTVFYDTLEREMSARNADKAVIVTGGFHTDGLTDIFREKGVNYAVLMPRVREELGKESYLNAMMETRETMFDLNAIVKALLLRDRETELELGGAGVGMGTSGTYGGRILMQSFYGILDDSDDSKDIADRMRELGQEANLFTILGGRVEFVASEGKTQQYLMRMPTDGVAPHEYFDVFIENLGNEHSINVRPHIPDDDDDELAKMFNDTDLLDKVIPLFEDTGLPSPGPGADELIAVPGEQPVDAARSEARQTVFDTEVLDGVDILLSQLSLKSMVNDRDRKLYAWTPRAGKFAATLKIGGDTIATRLLSHSDGFVETKRVTKPREFYDKLAADVIPAKDIESKVLDVMAEQFKEIIDQRLTEYIKLKSLTYAKGLPENLKYDDLIDGLDEIKRYGISTHGPFVNGNRDQSGTYAEDAVTTPFLKGTSLRIEIAKRLINFYKVGTKNEIELFKRRPDYFVRKISVKRDIVASAEGEMSRYGTVPESDSVLYASWGGDLKASLYAQRQPFSGDDEDSPLRVEIGEDIIWSPESGEYEYVGLMSEAEKIKYKNRYANANDHFGQDVMVQYFGERNLEELSPEEMLHAAMNFGKVLGSYMKAVYAQYKTRAIPADVIVGSYVAHQGIYHPYFLDAIKEGYHQEIHRFYKNELGYMHGLQKKHHDLIKHIRDKNNKVRQDKIEAMLSQHFGTHYAKMYMRAEAEDVESKSVKRKIKSIQQRDTRMQAVVNDLQLVDTITGVDRHISQAIAALQAHDYRRAIASLADANLAAAGSSADEQQIGYGKYEKFVEAINTLIIENKASFNLLPYPKKKNDYRELYVWESLAGEGSSHQEIDAAVGRILDGINLIEKTNQELTAEQADPDKGVAKKPQGLRKTDSGELQKIAAEFGVEIVNFPMLGFVEKINRDTLEISHGIGHVDLTAPIEYILEQTKDTRPPVTTEDLNAVDATLFSGGTGAPKVVGPSFRALNYIAAMIQTNLDDGGSSGDIVRALIENDYGVYPPPGDLMNALFTGYAKPYQLKGILGDDGRLIKEITDESGNKIINPDFDKSIYEQVEIRMAANREEFGKEYAAGSTEQGKFYDEFDAWKDLTLELIKFAQDELWNPDDESHRVIEKNKSSIRNIIFLGALKRYEFLERDASKPKYRNAVEGRELEFQQALDYVSEITGIKGVRISIASFDPAVLYATYEENTIRYQNDEGVWQLRLVRTEGDKVTVIVVRDPFDKSVEEIVLGEGETSDVIGGVIYGNLKGRVTLTHNGETWAIVEHDGINRTFLRKVNGAGELIRPGTIGADTEDDAIEMELSNNGSGRRIKLQDVVDPGTGATIQEQVLPKIGGREFTVRPRLTIGQDPVTQRVNFSEMTDVGAIDMNADTPRIGPEYGKAPEANDEAVKIIMTTKYIFVTGPGSTGTSLKPHALTKGTMEALMARVKDGVPSIFIDNIVNDNESTRSNLKKMMRSFERTLTRTLLGEYFDAHAYDTSAAYRAEKGVKFSQLYTHVVVNEGVHENWRPASLARATAKKLKEAGAAVKVEARSEARTAEVEQVSVLPGSVVDQSPVLVVPTVLDPALSYKSLLNNSFHGNDVFLVGFDLTAFEGESVVVIAAAVARGLLGDSIGTNDPETWIRTLKIFADQRSVDVESPAFAMEEAARNVWPAAANDNAGSLVDVLDHVPTAEEMAAHQDDLSIQLGQHNAIVIAVPSGQVSAAISEAKKLMEAAKTWADSRGNNITAHGRFRILVTSDTPRLIRKNVNRVASKLSAKMRLIDSGIRQNQNLVVAFDAGTEGIMDEGVWLGTLMRKNITGFEQASPAIAALALLSQHRGDAMRLNREIGDPVFVQTVLGYEFGPGFSVFAQTIWQRITEAAAVAKAA